MYIIIAGCRKVGLNLAFVLSQENHDIVVIDSDPKNLEPLGSGFNGLTINGMPIDEDVLCSAGIERADALAAVTNDDNMNAMISQIAKEIFKVPHVITRVYDPERENAFNKMGLKTICPTTLAVDKIKNLLIPKNRHETIDFNGTNVSFHYVKPPRRYIGKNIGKIKDETIFGLIRNEKFTMANPQDCIAAGDTLIVLECDK